MFSKIPFKLRSQKSDKNKKTHIKILNKFSHNLTKMLNLKSKAATAVHKMAKKQA